MTAAAVDQATLLETAGAIAAEIVATAVWKDDRCSWVGGMPEEGAGGQMKMTFRALTADLYGGTAGVGLFLAEMAEATDDPDCRRTARAALRHAVSRSDDIPRGSRCGLYAGRPGIALALALAGRALDDPELDRAAREIVAGSPSSEPEGELDLMAGSAGAIVGLLTLSALLDDGEALIGAATDHGDALLSSARHTATGLCWPSRSLPGAPGLTGWSHGAAGGAVALLELASATGEDRYRDAAEAAFAYERALFDPGARNWPDLRSAASANGSGQPTFATFWCHGAPGGALARLRALELGGGDELRQEARDALADDRGLGRGGAGLRSQLLALPRARRQCGDPARRRVPALRRARARPPGRGLGHRHVPGPGRALAVRCLRGPHAGSLHGACRHRPVLPPAGPAPGALAVAGAADAHHRGQRLTAVAKAEVPRSLQLGVRHRTGRRRPMTAHNQAQEQYTPRGKNLALLLLAMTQFVIVIDASIVNVALPSIGRAPALLARRPLLGRQRLHAHLRRLPAARRPAGRPARAAGGCSCSAWSLFSLASLAGGLAQSEGWLIAARAVQGLGAAIVSPAALSIITTTFAEGAERNRALGIWGAVAGAGGAAGVLLGGILTSGLSWRWVLFVNVPIGLAAAALAPRMLLESRAEDGAQHLRPPRRGHRHGRPRAARLRGRRRRQRRLGLDGHAAAARRRGRPAGRVPRDRARASASR